MKPKSLTIDIENTSYGKQYSIVDKNGTVYMTTYDPVVAHICCDALNERYPVD